MKEAKNEKNIKTIKRFFDKGTDEFEYTSKSLENSIDLANQFSKHLNQGDVVVLSGELGAGKTVFMYGVASYFGIESEVSSPTFSIVNEYSVKKHDNIVNRIFHFDVYRIKDSIAFVDEIGIDYFSQGLCILEWGKNIDEILPENTIYIDIEKDYTDGNENIRKFRIYRKEKRRAQ